MFQEHNCIAEIKTVQRTKRRPRENHFTWTCTQNTPVHLHRCLEIRLKSETTGVSAETSGQGTQENLMKGKSLFLLIFYLHFKYSPHSSAEARVENIVEEREEEQERKMERKRKVGKEEREVRRRGERGRGRRGGEGCRGRGIGLCVSPKDSLQ